MATFCFSLDSYSKETTPLSQIFGGYLRTEGNILIYFLNSKMQLYVVNLLALCKAASTLRLIGLLTDHNVQTYKEEYFYFCCAVQCLECNHVSVTFQHFQDMLLDIRQSSALDEALRAYFSRERLGDGEEGYRCDKCLRRVAATKQFSLEKPPNVLCIQLKRYDS